MAKEKDGEPEILYDARRWEAMNFEDIWNSYHTPAFPSPCPDFMVVFLSTTPWAPKARLVCVDHVRRVGDGVRIDTGLGLIDLNPVGDNFFNVSYNSTNFVNVCVVGFIQRKDAGCSTSPECIRDMEADVNA